jgi:hypothetical protein
MPRCSPPLVKMSKALPMRSPFLRTSLLQSIWLGTCLRIIRGTHPFVDPRHHLSDGMRLAALHHTEMAREIAILRATVSSTVESVLGCSPSDTFHVEVVGELATEFQKMEDRCSRLEQPAVRIYDLLLGPPTSRAQLAGHLDEAAR